MQKARCHHTQWLQPLVSAWFQVLFHSAVRGSFHLSFTVLVHYRCLRSIQPYQMVLADSSRISPVPPYSGYPNYSKTYRYGTITLYGPTFQLCSHSFQLRTSGPTTPQHQYTKVWALPRSLATTYGIIIIFSSSGYLDVSVPRVLFPHSWNIQTSSRWVAPFGHPRITVCLQLPTAFRSLPRPSSSPRAKASTIRPFKLPSSSIIRMSEITSKNIFLKSYPNLL